MRFDQFAATKFGISRNKALELIKNGSILLDGEICTKPSTEIYDGKIELLDEIYVSRGALKLNSFLDELNLDLEGKTALDIGSSTGGFVQILLQNGVKNVVALDVGSSQLNEALRRDERVKVHENKDIRNFIYDEKFDIITCDVSFISLNLIIEHIVSFAQNLVIFLFKPQFEVGKNIKRNKRGVVKDNKAISQARAKFEIKCSSLNLILLQTKECEVKGKEGNLEYFYLFRINL